MRPRLPEGPILPVGPNLPVGYRLAALDRVGSTNDEARVRAEAGEPSGLIVTAVEQDAGRGRQGRSWASPRGNLYCSFLLRPDRPAVEAAQMSLVAGVALAEAVHPLVGSRPLSLKWPNDLLLGGAKLAGILVEASPLRGNRPDFLIVGIGVNCASHPDGLPYAAADLGSAVSPEEMLEHLAERFAVRVSQWEREGFAPIRAAWLALADAEGRLYRSSPGGEQVEGRFQDLDETGALILATAAGPRRLASGEILPA